MGQTIAEVGKDTLALEQYLKTLEPDQAVTYTEIQQGSGVKMNSAGKQRIATAAKRARLVYTCMKGIGIQMAGPSSGRDIVVGRTERIDNAVKRAEKITAAVIAQHTKGMSADDKQQVELVATTFALIRVIADQKKQELKLASARKPVTVTPLAIHEVRA